jgi:hypothetical protein
VIERRPSDLSLQTITPARVIGRGGPWIEVAGGDHMGRSICVLDLLHYVYPFLPNFANICSEKNPYKSAYNILSLSNYWF